MPITSAACCAPRRSRGAREQHARGELDAAALQAVEDREIERVIKKQESIGLAAASRTASSGARGGISIFSGGSTASPSTCSTSASAFVGRSHAHGRRARRRQARLLRPSDARAFPLLAARTRVRVPKLTIPAPSALYGRPARAADRRARLPAARRASSRISARRTAAAVRAFAAAGCRYLQLDEVFIAMLCDPKYRAHRCATRGDDPDELAELYARLINTAIADAPADMTVTMHLCRGNFKSTFMGAAATRPFRTCCSTRSTCTAISWSTTTSVRAASSRCGCCRRARCVALGLVTTKRGALESKDELKRRIDAAANSPISTALPRAAMRVRVDGGGQPADRGRAMGEARADRRGRRPRCGVRPRRSPLGRLGCRQSL